MGNTFPSNLDSLKDEVALQILPWLQTPMEVMKLTAASPSLRRKILSPIVSRGLLDHYFRTNSCNMNPLECM